MISWDSPGIIHPDKGAYKIIVLIMILGVTFVSVFSTVSTILADQVIQGALGLSNRQAAWITTFTLLGINSVVPTASWFADHFGYKTMLFFGVSVFCFSSFLAACSINFPMLAIARILEGVGSGCIFPVGLATLTKVLPQNRQSMGVILYMSAGFGAGFALGLPISGYLIQFVSWRAVFAMLGSVSFLTMLSCAFVMNNTQRIKTKHFNILGAISLAVFIGALLVGLTYGPMPSTSNGWTSPIVLTCFAISAIFLCLTIYSEKTALQPILPFTLFRNGSFALGSITLFFLGMSLFSSAGTLMQYMVQGLQYERFVSGKIGFIFGFSLAIFSIFTRVLAKKVSSRVISTFGLFLLIISYFLNNSLSWMTGGDQVLLLLFLRGAGLGLSVGPVTAHALTHVPKHLESKAATLLTFFRQVGGTYGGTIISIIVIKRKIFHQALYSQQANPNLPQIEKMSQALSQYYHSNYSSLSLKSSGLAKLKIAQNLETQSFIQAQNDAMIVFGYITLFITAVLILNKFFEWSKQRQKAEEH